MPRWYRSDNEWNRRYRRESNFDCSSNRARTLNRPETVDTLPYRLKFTPMLSLTARRNLSAMAEVLPVDSRFV